MLNKTQFQKDFRKILIDEELTQAQAGELVGLSAASISQKVVNASFRYVDFVNLLDALGYDVVWVKRQENGITQK